jgi:hypothetical protein
MFAGVLMLVVGVFGILEGIAAIAEDDVYGRIGTYVFEFDLTAWGWIHLIVGILLLITGVAILRGTGWSHPVGIGFAALSIILHFMWLPYQPVWAIIAIGVAVFVIWALCADKERASVF